MDMDVDLDMAVSVNWGSLKGVWGSVKRLLGLIEDRFRADPYRR